MVASFFFNYFDSLINSSHKFFHFLERGKRVIFILKTNDVRGRKIGKNLLINIFSDIRSRGNSTKNDFPDLGSAYGNELGGDISSDRLGKDIEFSRSDFLLNFIKLVL